MRTEAERRLRHRCERALAAAGRASGAGSRQQVRAAARRFVRRHRGDVAHLEWALRCATASAALAVALLGLGAKPIAARTTLFTIPTTNPVLGQDVGSYSAPALADLDGDGDLDLVGGGNSGSFFYFENTGDAVLPAFVQRTGPANPLAGKDVGQRSTPAFGDLDHDGDLDLVAGEYQGFLNYYENTGSRTAATFVARTGAANPLNGQQVAYSSTPALGDLDADGDLDLVVGEIYGSFLYYENTGGTEVPAFLERTGSANPLQSKSAHYFSSPVLGDFDGDGDLDLVSGERYGSFFFFENTGSARVASFALRSEHAGPLFTLDAGLYATPAAGDLDGDGDLDLVSGESAGIFVFYVNRGGRLAKPPPAASDIFNGSAGINDVFPALGDLDDDGDLDLMRGSYDGTFVYHENTGSATRFAFVKKTDGSNPLEGENNGIWPVPAFGDLDADGDLDILSGDHDGSFDYYENTGTEAAADFALRTGSENPMNGRDVGDVSTAALADLDADGDLDFFSGSHYGGFFYFENVGTPSSAVLVPRTGAANPLAGVQGATASFSRVSFADFDADGDLDGIGSIGVSDVRYFENTGDAHTPLFVSRTGSAHPLLGQPSPVHLMPSCGDLDGDGDPDVVGGNGGVLLENAGMRPSPRYNAVAGPLDGKDVGGFATPAAGDLDGDGDSDFIASKSFGDGSIHYYENTGGVLSAAVIERTGAANPFAGLNAGSVPRLALGDLDGDGDLDLASGGYGVGDPSRYFENTGTAEVPVFVQQTGSANPLAGVAPGRTAPALGDLDRDGDLDVVAGQFNGSFSYYENTGDAEAPVLVQRTGGANPLNSFTTTNFSTPVLGDVDRDGDLDLVAGDEAIGKFAYFENTGSASTPAFVQRTSAAEHPLFGAQVAFDSSPVLVDLDGDGDLDMLSGQQDGTFRTFSLPEPGSNSLFAAGGALLAWLSRRRRRAT
jgi:uncharacterized protein (DUF2141 family)